MDIIFIALMQLLFLGGFIAFLVWLSIKLDAKKKDQRPGVEQEPELLKSLKGILEKLPGLSPEDKEIGENQGTFYTTAPFSNVWERCVDVFTRQPVGYDPKYNWKKITPDQAYSRFIMLGEWKEQHTLVAPPGAYDSKIENLISITCTLRFEQLDAGGTAIHFTYDINRFDINAEKLKRETNRRLRTICLQMTQDPSRGIPF